MSITTMDLPTRYSVNGHTVEQSGLGWRCLQCQHWFECVVDAEQFWCGDDCTGKHFGE